MLSGSWFRVTLYRAFKKMHSGVFLFVLATVFLSGVSLAALHRITGIELTGVVQKLQYTKFADSTATPTGYDRLLDASLSSVKMSFLFAVWCYVNYAFASLLHEILLVSLETSIKFRAFVYASFLRRHLSPKLLAWIESPKRQAAVKTGARMAAFAGRFLCIAVVPLSLMAIVGVFTTAEGLDAAADPRYQSYYNATRVPGCDFIVWYVSYSRSVSNATTDALREYCLSKECFACRQIIDRPFALYLAAEYRASILRENIMRVVTSASFWIAVDLPLALLVLVALAYQIQFGNIDEVYSDWLLATEKRWEYQLNTVDYKLSFLGA